MSGRLSDPYVAIFFFDSGLWLDSGVLVCSLTTVLRIQNAHLLQLRRNRLGIQQDVHLSLLGHSAIVLW